MSAGGVNIATAYLQIVPSLQGLQGSLRSGLAPAEAEAQRAGDAAGGVFSGAFGKVLKAGALVASVAALGEAAGAAFAGTFGAAMERESAVAKSSAALGLNPAQSKEQGALAGRLYSQAYGESIGDVSETITAVQSSLKGLDGAGLEGATKKAMSFAQAFDVDVTKSVSSVSTLMGSGLVKSSDEAFDLITRASQKVPAQLREDVLDASDEYSQFFNALGFTGAQAFGALTDASDKGMFGIDKTGDAIKEFTIRATDMSTSSVAAFQAIGLDANQMANSILAGGDQAQDATQQIVRGLQSIQDPAAQANTAIALFGTPIEDLGVQNIPAFLESLNGATGGMTDFAGAAGEVDSKLGGTIESKFTSMTRSVSGLTSGLAAGFLPLVGPVLDGITGLATKGGEKLVEFGEKFQAVIDISGSGEGYDAVGGRDSFLGRLANGLYGAREQLGLFGSQAVAVWKMSGGNDDPALLATVDGPDSFLGRLSSSLYGFREELPLFQDDVRAAFQTLATGDFDPSQWGHGITEDSPIVDYLFRIREMGMEAGQSLGRTWDTLVRTGTKLVEPAKSILSSLTTALGTLSASGFNLLEKTWSVLFTTLELVAGVLEDTLVPALTWLSGFMEDNPEMVLIAVGAYTAYKAAMIASSVATWAVQAATKAWAAGQWLLNAALTANPIGIVVVALAALAAGVVYAWKHSETFRNIVTGAWEAISSAATWAWENVLKPVFSWLGEAISGVVDFFSNFEVRVAEIWLSITGWLGDAVTSIITWFIELPGKIWDAIVQATAFVTSWGASILTWMWDGIKTVAVAVWDWFLGLPASIWSYVQQGWSAAVAWGTAILTWVWDGIKTVAVQVWDWFLGLPASIWSFVSTGWMQALTWGVQLLTWVWDGVKATASKVWNWFAALPASIWSFVQDTWDDFVDWGARIIDNIVKGVQDGAYKVANAVKDAVTGAGTGGDAGAFGSGVNVGPGGPLTKWLVGLFGAGGGVIPGYAPGVDSVPAMLSPGEGVLVPELTRAIGPAAIYAANRAARSGRAVGASRILGVEQFALGGIVGEKYQALGGQLIGGVAAALGRIVGAVKGALGTAGMGGGAGDGSYKSNGQWGPENMRGLAANTAAARDFVMSRWGIKNIGGWSPSGSVSTSDHPKGKALDVMIPDYKSTAGIALGTGIADWFINNPNAFGTKYTIWRDRINNQGRGWSPYSHPSGNNDTLQHRDHVHLSFLAGDGSFSGSVGQAERSGDTAQTGSWLSGVVQQIQAKTGAAAAALGATPAGVAGGKFDPLVERWRPLMTDVLGKVGAYKGMDLSGYVDRGLNQIRTESSGKPDAINNYDINAQRGDPSIGLLQVIGSTFRAALRGTPFEALISAGQRDPRASITASTLYSLGRYKTLDRAWRGVAYDNGGWLQPGQTPTVNMLGKPEPVLTPYQWDAASKAIDLVVSGGDGIGGPQVLYVDRMEIGGETIAERVRVALTSTVQDASYRLDVMAGQAS